MSLAKEPHIDNSKHFWTNGSVLFWRRNAVCWHHVLRLLLQRRKLQSWNVNVVWLRHVSSRRNVINVPAKELVTVFVLLLQNVLNGRWRCGVRLSVSRSRSALAGWSVASVSVVSVTGASGSARSVLSSALWLLLQRVWLRQLNLWVLRCFRWSNRSWGHVKVAEQLRSRYSGHVSGLRTSIVLRLWVIDGALYPLVGEQSAKRFWRAIGSSS